MRKFFFISTVFLLSFLSFFGIEFICSKLFDIDVLFFRESLNLSKFEVYSLVFIWGALGGLFNSLTSSWQVKRFYNLKPVDTGSVLTKRLHVLNNKIATKLKVKPARLYMYKSEEKNAFVSGFFKNRSLLAVSSNLLYSLNERELEAILYHEYAHIVNGDMSTQQILEGVMNSYLLFGSKIIQLSLIKGSSFSGSIIILAVGTFFEWVFLFFAKIFYLWFSRKKEMIADSFAVKHQGSLVSILSALQNVSYQEETNESKALLGKKFFNIYEYKNEILSTHPNFKNRVINIEKSI